MKIFLLSLALAFPGAAFGMLQCHEVVAGMAAVRSEVPLEQIVALLEGAREKGLPVRVTYDSRWARRGTAEATAFVLPVRDARRAATGFDLQLDDRTLFVRKTALVEVHVLPAPPRAELEQEARIALDRLRDAWERRRPVSLYLVEEGRPGFFASWFDGPERIYVDAVRPSVRGGWLVDYHSATIDWWNFRGTYRFERINPVTVKY